MYKAIKDFTDQMKDCHKYRIGDAYEEISPIWTKYLVDNKCIEKVSFEKKDETVQKEQKEAMVRNVQGKRDSLS